jgi:purine-binding chemotaxis protein CheW
MAATRIPGDAPDDAADVRRDPVVDERPPERASRTLPPVRRDPLADFLAVYDEGEAAWEDVQHDDQVPAVDEEKRFLSFDLAGEAYAANIMDVREILKVVSLTEVPRAPREVLGVLSKRGVVMPVVDLAAVLGLRSADTRIEKDQRVLVAGDGDRVCGLRVDRVRHVVRLSQRNIEDVPPSLGARNAHMLIGLGRARVEQSAGQQGTQMLILLDVNAVLDHFSETMGIAPLREGERG